MINLSEFGCRVSMDDFKLKRYPLDVIVDEFHSQKYLWRKSCLRET